MTCKIVFWFIEAFNNIQEAKKRKNAIVSSGYVANANCKLLALASFDILANFLNYSKLHLNYTKLLRQLKLCNVVYLFCTCSVFLLQRKLHQASGSK